MKHTEAVLALPSALDVYLEEIGRTPILTAEEEQALGARMQRGECATLEEVGAEFGITRERARQIEAEAFRVIRQRPELAKRLYAHLQEFA